MKKRGTMIGIVLAVLGILLLAVLGLFLLLHLNHISSGELFSRNANSASHAAARAETDRSGLTDGRISSINNNADSKQTDDALEALQTGQALPDHHIIFVGDSRTVGMGNAEEETDDSCLYIGEVGEGFTWFSETGIAQMETAMEQNPDAPVVLNLGVNDLDMIDHYLELYGTFAQRYPGRQFYFLSVNPVTSEAEHVTNEEIADFNRKLRQAFGETYLDCNLYLKIKEFESVDGVHYSEDTYRMIHDFAVTQIAKAETGTVQS